jgi:hypothetical protein
LSRAIHGRRLAAVSADAPPLIDRETDYFAFNKDEYVAARVCGDVSVQTVRRWRAKGIGPQYRRVGALVRYSLAGCFSWMEAQPSGGAETARGSFPVLPREGERRIA